MHMQVQCLDVVDDVHVPPAFSRFSISSISKSSERGLSSFFSCMLYSFALGARTPGRTIRPRPCRPQPTIDSPGSQMKRSDRSRPPLLPSLKPPTAQLLTEPRRDVF